MEFKGMLTNVKNFIFSFLGLPSFLKTKKYDYIEIKETLEKTEEEIEEEKERQEEEKAENDFKNTMHTVYDYILESKDTAKNQILLNKLNKWQKEYFIKYMTKEVFDKLDANCLILLFNGSLSKVFLKSFVFGNLNYFTQYYNISFNGVVRYNEADSYKNVDYFYSLPFDKVTFNYVKQNERQTKDFKEMCNIYEEVKKKYFYY